MASLKKRLADFFRKAAQRFMVDIAIFKEMHTPDAKTPPKRDDIGSDAMLLEEPPSESGFVLCLPTTIPGFNMQKKEWGRSPISQRTPCRFANKRHLSHPGSRHHQGRGMEQRRIRDAGGRRRDERACQGISGESLQCRKEHRSDQW